MVLTGARQTGKTTLLRDLFRASHGYVSLDLPQDAALAEQAPDRFLAQHPPPLLVDEVQYAPMLFRHLKRVVDATDVRGQFVLTGSQRLLLMGKVTESLAGRAATFELHGLSATELGETLRDELSLAGLGGVMARGTWPALWEDRQVPIVDFMRSYVSTYLERDLRQLLNVGSLRDFERFLRACAARSAQLLNKSDLARDVGLAVSTVTEWLSVLEASGLVLILEPYFANHSKRLVKTPKLYLTDVGLMVFLLGLDATSAGTWSGLGALWETWVLGELVRWREASHPEAQLFFARDRDGREADFVIQHAGGLTVLDAKLAELPDAKALRQLETAAATLGKTPHRLAVVTPGTAAAFPGGPGVDVVSGWRLADWLERERPR